MAETLYSGSTSGYTSTGLGWSTSSSSLIQGSTGTYTNYYGILYLDFAAFRTKANSGFYPAKLRLRLKAHTTGTDIVRLYMGKGMAKDDYTSGARPSAANGTTYKELSVGDNAWGEWSVTDPTWLAALLDATTTCFYINRGSDATNYKEFDGCLHTNKPQLYIDWMAVPTAPTTFTGAPNPVVSGDLALSWSGAGGTIGSYEVQVCDSADGVNFGSWVALTDNGAGIITSTATSGSLNTTDYNPVAGSYSKYRIRSRSTNNERQSAWKESNVIQHSAAICMPPTMFKPQRCTTRGSQVTLEWSGAAGGSGNTIVGYEIERKTASSPQDLAGASWEAVTVVASTLTSGSLAVNTPADYQYRAFRIRTRGSSGAEYYSDWFETEYYVRKCPSGWVYSSMVTDRVLNDVINKTDKGYINLGDYNRIVRTLWNLGCDGPVVPFNELPEPYSDSSMKVHMGTFEKLHQFLDALLVAVKDTLMVNLIFNHDMSLDTTSYSAGATGALTVEDGILRNTLNGLYAINYILQDTATTLNTSHIYFSLAKVRVVGSGCTSIRFAYDGASGGTDKLLVEVANPTSGEWFKLSGRATTPADASGYFRLFVANAEFTSAAEANGKLIEVDGDYGVYCIDLTEIYGAGNEPGEIQFYEILNSWIELVKFSSQYWKKNPDWQTFNQFEYNIDWIKKAIL